ncbi:hypothetical protein E2P30_01530 [Candidatus Bathyarchaeota archaeon]|nr:hypothetical protein E2P30_01530 [Candidatus Bathyarchaeota archaeon]
MNWLIIIANAVFCIISASLCILGWNTLKAIKYLNIGKLFWIPIFLSSVLFAVGSLITILNDMFFSSILAFEIEQITQLVALCFLSVGIFSYSKIIRRNIPEKNIIPEDIPTLKSKTSPYVSKASSVDHKKNGSNNFQTETPKCNHEVGYLATFPANASLPEECLSCNKVMECKQS